MNMTESQYQEMCKIFPGIDSYIIRCQLVNEYRYLKDNEYILNEWEKGRFIELTELFES